jgi:hypothetical protein
MNAATQHRPTSLASPLPPATMSRNLQSAPVNVRGYSTQDHYSQLIAFDARYGRWLQFQQYLTGIKY